MKENTRQSSPPIPGHISGTAKGEERTLTTGKEPGRGGSRGYRSARDATGINPQNREPINPAMPEMPPV